MPRQSRVNASAVAEQLREALDADHSDNDIDDYREGIRQLLSDGGVLVLDGLNARFLRKIITTFAIPNVVMSGSGCGVRMRDAIIARFFGPSSSHSSNFSRSSRSQSRANQIDNDHDDEVDAEDDDDSEEAKQERKYDSKSNRYDDRLNSIEKCLQNIMSSMAASHSDARLPPPSVSSSSPAAPAAAAIPTINDIVSALRSIPSVPSSSSLSSTSPSSSLNSSSSSSSRAEGHSSSVSLSRLRSASSSPSATAHRNEKGVDSFCNDDYANAAAISKADRSDVISDFWQRYASSVDEVDRERIAPGVLHKLGSNPNALLEWVKPQYFKEQRNKRECLVLAQAVQAILEEDSDIALEIIVRRLLGVHAADKNNNWHFCSALEFDDSSVSLIPQSTLTRCVTRAAQLERVAAPTNKSRSYSNSNWGRRNNNNNNYSNKSNTDYINNRNSSNKRVRSPGGPPVDNSASSVPSGASQTGGSVPKRK
jgi:hypothetical protein